MFKQNLKASSLNMLSCNNYTRCFLLPSPPLSSPHLSSFSALLSHFILHAFPLLSCPPNFFHYFSSPFQYLLIFFSSTFLCSPLLIFFSFPHLLLLILPFLSSPLFILFSSHLLIFFPSTLLFSPILSSFSSPLLSFLSFAQL